MRKGLNPHKDKQQEKSEFIHQVIIPVYIPNQQGYFKDSFRILQICLESLFKTAHSKTFISVIDNGSSNEIKEYLDSLFTSQKIHEVIHTANIGKLNSIVKGLVGNNIELVTISDSDVFFLENWQNETVKIFNAFPKAGVVGVVPQFRVFSHLCGNLISENFFSKKLKFTEVKNPEAMKKFFHSIWGEDSFNPVHLKWNLTIENKKDIAVVGSGHFVATYKKSIFQETRTYFDFKMGADTEKYLDEMPLKKGLWRLTTNDNYAYHMGNAFEDWMQETLDKIAPNNVKPEILLPTRDVKDSSKIDYFTKNRLFMKFFSNKTVRRFFYKIKGLPKDEIANY
ncbi:MAG: glycosyltransferase family 2 protein [Flavobacterium sp.]|uniref:glycosyltransferase family A protein n=1 Tax=Flavobacterium sp. TaxID=239 RepID=UPI003262F347